MSTTAPTPGGRWTRFWFTPADPTTLGFMRIVTGLLALYVHAVYSLDFQAFFGKNGWYGLKEIEVERREFPWMLSPFAGQEAWNDVTPAAHVPIFPHRREAVMQFVRGLPADKAARAERLAYLVRLQRTANQTAINDGLMYVRQLPTDDRARAAHLDAMVNKALRQPIDAVPAFLDAMPETGADSRAAVKAEIQALVAALPADHDRRTFVVDHLLEMDYPQRQAFLTFLGNLPADPAERAIKIDYLEFWNTEREKAYRVGHPTFSLWFHITDPTAMAVAHGCVLVVITLFTVGLWTRVTSVLTWVAAVSYIHRTQQVLFGMDTMMNVLLIYLMVGNSGAALSVDRLLNRYRAARNSLRRTGTIDPATRAYLDAPPKSVVAGFAYRLVQIHFCFMYMAAGLSKLKGGAWWNTNAFWDTMVNPEFTMVHFQWYEALLRGLVEHRWVYAFYAAAGVGFTIALEIGLPFLVWTRLRPWVVIGGIMLHFGIAVFMGLILFGLLMMTLLVSYIPGNVIREQLLGTADGVKRVFRFNGRSAKQLRAAALVKALDADGTMEVLDTSSGGVRLTADGKELTGRAAGADLFTSLGVTRKVWLLALVPGLGGWLAGWLAPSDAPPPAAPPPTPDSAGKEPVGAK